MRKGLHHFIAASLALSVGLAVAPPPIVVAQASLVHSQSVHPRPTNLDFEEGTPGQVPRGWDCPTKATYAAEMTDEHPQSGKLVALLHSINTSEPGPNFGNLMQAFDATPFRGHRVNFKAYVRTEVDPDEGRAQLWLRVDRTGNQPGFFANMMDRPITSREWRAYEITGDVEEDAAVINIGMILVGRGKAWIDAASFADLGKLVVPNDPPRRLTARGLENLVAFTRLLGYVRHFHPSDEAAKTNWDSFAIDGVKEAEGAKDSKQLARILQDLFTPIAPTLRVYPTGTSVRIPDELSPKANEPALKIVSWRHRGFGQVARQGSIYVSERLRVDAPNGKIPEGSSDPHHPFKADLGGGVSCLVPLALFADASGTLPHGPPNTRETLSQLVTHSGNERAARLADVALTWNILQHFYPYFDVVRTDWPQTLKDSLTSAATDANELAFLVTLRRMIAQLHDGHGNVFFPGEANTFTVPLIFGWIEGRLVITEVTAEVPDGPHPGDIVLKVQGKPSLDVLSEKEALISGATPQWRRYVALTLLGGGVKDSEMTLEVENPDGEVRTVKVRRTAETETLSETRPTKISEVKPGIFYVALDRIKDQDFETALPQLEKAKGIVFDLRGYPSVSPMIISHLIDTPVTSARWMVPIVTTPDRTNITYDTSGRWDLKPIPPRLKGKIAFLTDGRAISYAESYMGIIEAYKLAEIVGEPTAGTNGNINPFKLTGGYTIIWTGMKVLKHDGSQHHGVGIQPTVPASRTIQGIRARRDEQLERAIAIVSQ